MVNKMSYETSKNKIDHTRTAYNGLAEAYDYFNKALFNDELPNCLITVQRKKNCFGYFSPDRFSQHEAKTDEIALNPVMFPLRTPKQVLSTLVHEMVHLWQQHFGEPSRGGYHNKEWAIKMKAIGLHPSSTGEQGGKEVGSKVSHYIITGGKFCFLCDEFLSANEFVLYADSRTEAQQATAKKKAQSKTKFTCEMCGQNAWAKPDAHIKCGLCDELMLAEDGSEPEGVAA